MSCRRDYAGGLSGPVMGLGKCRRDYAGGLSGDWTDFLPALFGSTKSPTDFLLSQYAAFIALPDQVKSLQQQIVRVMNALPASDVTSRAALGNAQGYLAQVTANYPQTYANVQRLMDVLRPYLDQGGSGASVPANVWLAAGVDAVKTVGDVRDIFGLRDRAQNQVRDVVLNTNLPSDVKVSVADAFVGGGLGTWVPVGIAVLAVYLLFRPARRA